MGIRLRIGGLKIGSSGSSSQSSLFTEIIDGIPVSMIKRVRTKDAVELYAVDLKLTDLGFAGVEDIDFEMIYGREVISGIDVFWTPWLYENLFKWSEDLVQGWSISNGTITPDQETDLTGGLTVDLVTNTTTGVQLYRQVPVKPLTEYELSWDVKRGTVVSYCQYAIQDSTSGGFIVNATNYFAGTSAAEMRRLTKSFTTPAGCILIQVKLLTSLTNGTVFIGRCQLARKGKVYVKTEGTLISDAIIFKNFVLEGHSFLSAGSYLNDSISEEAGLYIVTTYTSAIGGSGITGVVARAAVVDSKLIAETRNYKNALILYIGVNDVAHTAGQGATAYNALKSYVQASVIAGWKVFVYTMIASDNVDRTGAYHAQWVIESNIFNNSMRNDLSLIPNVYILDTDTIAGLSEGTADYAVNYNADKLHPINAGAALLRILLLTKMNEVYP